MEETKLSVGRIIGVTELNIEVLVEGAKLKAKDVLSANLNGTKQYFEVAKVSGNKVSCIPFFRVNGLKRGLEVELEPTPIQAVYSDAVLGKMFDPYGTLIDNNEQDLVANEPHRSVYEGNIPLNQV